MTGTDSVTMAASSAVPANRADACAIIADDHPLFRSALRQALGTTLEGEVLDAAGFDDLLTLLRSHPRVELVLLDLNMPGNKGLTGLTTLRNQFPDVLVIIVSANEQPVVIQRAMSFGASAYVPKSTSLPDIVTAVQTVLAGDSWLPTHLGLELPEQHNNPHREFARKLDQLTPQQFKVLCCIADGMLNKQIAYELDIQETTVKQHVSAILHKFGVINRTQAGVLFHDMLRADDEDNRSEDAF